MSLILIHMLLLSGPPSRALAVFMIFPLTASPASQGNDTLLLVQACFQLLRIEFPGKYRGGRPCHIYAVVLLVPADLQASSQKMDSHLPLGKPVSVRPPRPPRRLPSRRPWSPRSPAPRRAFFRCLLSILWTNSVLTRSGKRSWFSNFGPISSIFRWSHIVDKNHRVGIPHGDAGHLPDLVVHDHRLSDQSLPFFRPPGFSPVPESALPCSPGPSPLFHSLP